jgi:tetratricopeptide (TPR) repeat protein
MQTYRIFVSSPNDAQFERQRVDRIIARLNGELAGAARLVSVRWEMEFYRAHDTFQTQIPASTDCDVVVAIFRGRLGTALPPDFTHMPDGAPYPSGTAYEVLTAIAKRQQGGELPDVFVFRYPDPPLVRLDDAAKEEETRRQWEGLKAFFARWFLTPEGHFKAAFQTFTSTDDFEEQVERLLRDWLQHKLAKAGTVTWPIATKGSPYPGLQSFGPIHAPVFFGRARDTARAVEAWSEAGARGTPFLLVVGASGSGKSSLARAGLVPRLTTPGVIASVDVWRVAVLRPSDSPDGPLAALVHALMQGAADLPKGVSKHETGRLPALPEIADGDYRTPAELAALLAHGDAASIKPIIGALDKVAHREQEAQGSDRRLRCDLVILIDQLDELFSAAVSDDVRRQFVVVLEQLVASGRVWIVTTLRADLYELFLKDESLFRLKDRGVAYDLAPPALADMAEVVRGPARAANLQWEIDAASKEPLDERIIRDIDRPDLLPIVQFVLDRLYLQRDTRDDEVVLTNAAYHALGTLNGAIETAAEAALAPLGPAAAAALPRLLRGLVSAAAPAAGARAATPALRQAPLDAVAHDENSKRLVRALVDARILVSGRDQSGVAVVGFAHQRVIEAWTRAREIITESVDLLRVREDVEEARRRWDVAGQRSDLLIRAGLPLSEAEHAAAALADELSASTRAFIEKSGRSARLRQRLTAAAAMVFLALAVAAGFLGFVAQTQKLKAQQAAEEAERQRAQAENARGQAEMQRQQAESARKVADQQRQQAETARQLADLQRQQAELRLAAADELLDSNGKIEELRQCLASTARMAAQPPPAASREFFVGRWHVDQGGGSSDVDWRDDGTCETRNIFADSTHPLDLKTDLCTWQFEKVANDSFVVAYQSTKLGDNYPKRLSFKIVSPIRIRNSELNYDAFRIVCPAQELQGHQQELENRQRLAAADLGNLTNQRDLATAHIKVGDVLAAQGQHKAALEDYVRGSEIRRNLAVADPGNQAWQRDLAIGYDRVGQAHQILGETAEALESYKSSLAVRQKLYLANRRDFTTQHELASSLDRVGALLKAVGNGKLALSAYQQSVLLRQGLADANRDNAQLQSELAVSLYLSSTVSEPPAAKDALLKALAVLEALERDQKLTSTQADWPKFIRGEIAKLP